MYESYQVAELTCEMSQIGRSGSRTAIADVDSHIATAIVKTNLLKIS